MPPVSYKGILSRANYLLDQFKEYAEEIDENGLRKAVRFIDEITNLISDCSREIGKLDVYISQHKNPIEYEKVRNELEEVLIKLKNLI